MDDALNARLNSLEREVRQWRRRFAAAALVVATIMIGAGAHFARSGKTIEAEKIVLRDDEGIIRGVFGIRADGGIGIDLNDARGRKRLGVSVVADGQPGIGLRDRDGEQLVQIFCTPGEGAGIAVRDSKSVNRVGLGVRADGQFGMTIAGRDVRGHDDYRGGFMAMPDGTTLLDVKAFEQRGRILIRCGLKSEPELLIWDDHGVKRTGLYPLPQAGRSS